MQREKVSPHTQVAAHDSGIPCNQNQDSQLPLINICMEINLVSHAYIKIIFYRNHSNFIKNNKKKECRTVKYSVSSRLDENYRTDLSEKNLTSQA